MYLGTLIWLSYCDTSSLDVTLTFAVPSAPTKNEGFIGAFWYGLEPVPACDLLQPVLALGRVSLL